MKDFDKPMEFGEVLTSVEHGNINSLTYPAYYNMFLEMQNLSGKLIGFQTMRATPISLLHSLNRQLFNCTDDIAIKNAKQLFAKILDDKSLLDSKDKNTLYNIINDKLLFKDKNTEIQNKTNFDNLESESLLGNQSNIAEKTNSNRKQKQSPKFIFSKFKPLSRSNKSSYNEL
ncbi:hypothetical protein L3V83_11130 [Thiotrichales bacterium 19X7-9]|nr:hypothetical protein [Thiotrichales bacterium 19X7-9]